MVDRTEDQIERDLDVGVGRDLIVLDRADEERARRLATPLNEARAVHSPELRIRLRFCYQRCDHTAVGARAKAPEGMRWVKIATLADEALPNVMRKVIAHGLNL